MHELPDPDWYLDDVLVYAEPGSNTLSRGPAAQWHAWWSEQAARLASSPVTALARGQGFVVRSDQLRTFGWADHDLRREVRRGRWSTPGFGVASPIVVPPGMERFRADRIRHALASTAASLRRDGQIIGGRSAAILHGVPTLVIPAAPELSVATPTTLGRHGSVRTFGATLTMADVTTWYGAPVQTLARTIVDLARRDRREGLIAADAALHERLVSRAALDVALTEAAGWPGIRQARFVIEFAAALAETPLESLLRLKMHDSGFPEPELQVEIYDPKYDCVYRVDMLLRQQRLIIEADGREKYTDSELWREKRREGRLRALTDCRVERVIWSDAMVDWPETAERLWLACEPRSVALRPPSPNSGPAGSELRGKDGPGGW
jgi:hypothetical protein